jgi:hypothetical protein
MSVREPENVMIYERARTLMEAELGDELVGLEPDGGVCFGFNSVAKRVWQLLSEPRSSEQLALALLKEFDVTPIECTDGLNEVLIDLTDLKLITSRST